MLILYMVKLVFHAGKLNGIENIAMIVYGGVAHLPLVRAFGSSQLAITSQSAAQHLRPHLLGAPIVRSITQGLVPVTFRKDVAGRRLFRPPAERVTPPWLLWHLAVH